MLEDQADKDTLEGGWQDIARFFFCLDVVLDQIRRYAYLRGRKEAAYDMALVALESRFGPADDEMKTLLWHIGTEERRDFVCFLHLRKDLNEACAWLKHDVNLDEIEPEQPKRWVQRTPGDFYQAIFDGLLEGYTKTEWTDYLASNARTLIKLLHKDVGEELLAALDHANADTLEDIIVHLNRYDLERIRTMLGPNVIDPSSSMTSHSPSN